MTGASEQQLPLAHVTGQRRCAFKLAPRNPRAVFLSSMDGLAYAKPGTAQLRHAFAEPGPHLIEAALPPRG